MKKLIAIFVGVVLTVAAIALTSSCQKDINNAKSLIGTSWESGSAYTITFKSTTEYDLTIKGSAVYVVPGTYIITGSKDSLAGSTITLTYNKDLDEAIIADALFINTTLSGTFTSNTELLLNNVKFTKK